MKNANYPSTGTGQRATPSSSCFVSSLHSACVVPGRGIATRTTTSPDVARDGLCVMSDISVSDEDSEKGEGAEEVEDAEGVAECVLTKTGTQPTLVLIMQSCATREGACIDRYASGFNAFHSPSESPSPATHTSYHAGGALARFLLLALGSSSTGSPPPPLLPDLGARGNERARLAAATFPRTISRAKTRAQTSRRMMTMSLPWVRRPLSLSLSEASVDLG